MREFGVRRYGDTQYHHCMAESAADAAAWFGRARPELARHDFKALVKDVSLPVTDEIGLGDNPSVVPVRHGAWTETSSSATDLQRMSLIALVT